MLGHIKLIFGLVLDLFRSQATLEADHGTSDCPAKAASCPQLAEGDIQELAERSGFDPKEKSRLLACCRQLCRVFF